MTLQGILDWAMQTGLAVSILIMFVLILRKPVARYMGARTAYALWALPVFRLFLPAIPVLPAKVLEAPVALPPEFLLTEAAFMAPASSLPSSTSTALNWNWVLMGIWISGALVWLVLQAFRQWQFGRELDATSYPATPAIQAKLNQTILRLGFKSEPAVRLSRTGNGPLVTGLWRPIIILPETFETDFTPNQQIHALAHELSHLRQGDLWISAAALTFRALNWPNPLVHLAAPQFRADQEAACDARVIALLGDDRSTRTAYADTLIRAARLSKYSAQPIPLGLTISNPLKERLMILKANPTQRRSLRMALAGAAGLALLATAPLTSAQTPTPPTTPDTEVTAKSVEKKVMKWVSNENGVETTKHIEIITEDGVTTAWEIDEIGNRIQVPVDSLDMPMHMDGHGDGKMRVMVKKMGDGQHVSEEEIEVMIADALEGIDLESLEGKDGQRRMIIKRLGPDGELMTEDVFGGMHFDIEKLAGEHGVDGKSVIVMESHGMVDVTSDGQNSFVFHSGDHMKSKPDMMVDVATKMMDGIDTNDMDRKTRKKIEAAQKALKEAQDALAANK